MADAPESSRRRMLSSSCERGDAEATSGVRRFRPRYVVLRSIITFPFGMAASVVIAGHGQQWFRLRILRSDGRGVCFSSGRTIQFALCQVLVEVEAGKHILLSFRP